MPLGSEITVVGESSGALSVEDSVLESVPLERLEEEITVWAGHIAAAGALACLGGGLRPPRGLVAVGCAVMCRVVELEVRHVVA